MHQANSCKFHSWVTKARCSSVQSFLLHILWHPFVGKDGRRGVPHHLSVQLTSHRALVPCSCVEYGLSRKTPQMGHSRCFSAEKNSSVCLHCHQLRFSGFQMYGRHWAQLWTCLWHRCFLTDGFGSFCQTHLFTNLLRAAAFIHFPQWATYSQKLNRDRNTVPHNLWSASTSRTTTAVHSPMVRSLCRVVSIDSFTTCLSTCPPWSTYANLRKWTLYVFGDHHRSTISVLSGQSL